jgi:outer membrane protein OmpA-like peptidoglycan-associated protein
MNDSDDSGYYWPAFVDFMAVLFFIALSIGGYMFGTAQKRIEAVADKEKKVDNLRDTLEGLKEFQTALDQMMKIKKSLEEEFRKNQIEIDSSYTEKIKLKGDFFFEKDSAALKPEAIANTITIGNNIKSVLNADSNYLKYTVIVEGHTDADGDEYHNNNLSFQRASSIIKLWSENCDFKLPQFEILPAGYGELKPIASNSEPEGKKLNRRIEIAILPKFSEFTRLLQISKEIIKR